MADRLTDSDAASAGPGPMWRFALVQCMALLPSVVMFGIAVGVLAGTKGFSVLEVAIMSATVFAGASQVAALEAWTSPPALLTLGLIVASVNSRYFLVGATLGPVFRSVPPVSRFVALFMTVDANWALATQLRASALDRTRFLLFTGYLLMGIWVASTMFGLALGGTVGDPRALGVDLMVIVYFAALLPPMWHGGRQVASWGTAVTVALLIWWFFGGHYHIVAGGVSGALVAAFYGVEPVAEVGEADGHA